jgi:hypothetical protein
MFQPWLLCIRSGSIEQEKKIFLIVMKVGKLRDVVFVLTTRLRGASNVGY